MLYDVYKILKFLNIQLVPKFLSVLYFPPQKVPFFFAIREWWVSKSLRSWLNLFLHSQIHALNRKILKRNFYYYFSSMAVINFLVTSTTTKHTKNSKRKGYFIDEPKSIFASFFYFIFVSILGIILDCLQSEGVFNYFFCDLKYILMKWHVLDRFRRTKL